MQIIQPHYHAIARTAQDYERMAMSGVTAVCEPAFWADFDRRFPETFIDYFVQISEFLEKYGTERILVNSSADWGPSDPFTLQECILEYRRRGHSLLDAVEVFHNNPCRFLGQNPKWEIQPIRIETESAA
jgi:predicted metal-dependent TIM-barrel fold hydrolase